MIFGYDKIYNIMGKHKIFLGFSALIFIASLVVIALKTPNYGIDFIGGTVVQVKYKNQAPLKQIRQVLDDSNLKNASIKEFGASDEIIIRLAKTSHALGTDIGDTISAILAPTGDFEVRRVDMVGSKVGKELREKGISAIIFALLGVLIYISLRFEWRFAIASIAALVHDITITTALIIVLNVNINLEILAAMLTILGYSLNDTIIVFDRIRETLSVRHNKSLHEIMNEAISMTLSRTTLTSLTTFFVVFVLYIFGTQLIEGLSLTLMIGIIIGTYSSIFIAASLLNIFKFSPRSWQEKESKKEAQRREKMRIRSQFEQGSI